MAQMNGIGSNALTNGVVDRTDRTPQTDKPSRSTAVDATKTQASQDVASFSGAGSVLAVASANTDDVRTDRVASLKAAVDSGNYNVPADAVADKLLSSMLE
ncbi:flagellar biosynthesis anti-sigma factor FlgM [Terriglobus sp. RCC_193]|uniref:flagellar biosynthesis anti-sigma factor FlgM n=1 Tax=Terriglobus sp. RCC_193 TaxID=3239218 RepID=UPI0035269445